MSRCKRRSNGGPGAEARSSSTGQVLLDAAALGDVCPLRETAVEDAQQVVVHDAGAVHEQGLALPQLTTDVVHMADQLQRQASAAEEIVDVRAGHEREHLLHAPAAAEARLCSAHPRKCGLLVDDQDALAQHAQQLVPHGLFVAKRHGAAALGDVCPLRDTAVEDAQQVVRHDAGAVQQAQVRRLLALSDKRGLSLGAGSRTDVHALGNDLLQVAEELLLIVTHQILEQARNRAADGFVGPSRNASAIGADKRARPRDCAAMAAGPWREGPTRMPHCLPPAGQREVRLWSRASLARRTLASAAAAVFQPFRAHFSWRLSRSTLSESKAPGRPRWRLSLCHPSLQGTQGRSDLRVLPRARVEVLVELREQQAEAGGKARRHGPKREALRQARGAAEALRQARGAEEARS